VTSEADIRITSSTLQNIDLRGIWAQRKLNLTALTLRGKQGLVLEDATVTSFVRLVDLTADQVVIKGCKFLQSLIVTDTTIKGVFTISASQIQAFLCGATTEDNYSLELGGDFSLNNSQVETEANFADCFVGTDLRIYMCDIGGSISFSNSLVGDKLDVTEVRCGAFLAAPPTTKPNIPSLTTKGPINLKNVLMPSGSMQLRGLNLHGSNPAVVISGCEMRSLQLEPVFTPDKSVAELRIRGSNAGSLYWGSDVFAGFDVIKLDGFRYEYLIDAPKNYTSFQRLLESDPEEPLFTYTQLATALERTGNWSLTREIKLARDERKAQGDWQSGNVIGYAVGKIRMSAIYGYGSFVTVIVLVCSWFFAGCLFLIARYDFLLAEPKSDERLLPRFRPFLYSFDVLVPGVPLGFEKDWLPIGNEVVYIRAGLIVIGWVGFPYLGYCIVYSFST